MMRAFLKRRTYRGSRANKRPKPHGNYLNLNSEIRCFMRFIPFIVLVLIFTLIIFYMNIYIVSLRRTALTGWDYQTSRNIASYVRPNEDITLLEPFKTCEVFKTFVVIIVFSSLGNFKERQIIRETWGNTTHFNYDMFSKMHAPLKGLYLPPSKKRMKYYSPYLVNKSRPIVRVLFLLGTEMPTASNFTDTNEQIRVESKQYEDIIQQNFTDSYNNLTLKSVLALKWLKTRKCLENCAYYLKSDDDTFVNVPNLMHYLLGGTVPVYDAVLEFYDIMTLQTLLPTNRLSITRNFLAGRLLCDSKPIKNVKNKWYMPHYMFPAAKYPPFLSGVGYIMSMDVVSLLYEIALRTPLISLEDVFLTGICAEQAQIIRQNHPLFTSMEPYTLCNFRGKITQYASNHIMAWAYRFVTNFSHTCSPPREYFDLQRLVQDNTCMRA